MSVQITYDMQIDKETIILGIVVVASTIALVFNKMNSDDYMKILLFVLGYVTKTIVVSVRRK